MSRECRGQRGRLLPDVSGSEHTKLHRRYRQPVRFIVRQLRRKTGGGTRNRERGNGCDGQGCLLHLNSPGDRDSRPEPISLLLHCDIAISQCNNARPHAQLMVINQSVSRKVFYSTYGKPRSTSVTPRALWLAKMQIGP